MWRPTVLALLAVACLIPPVFSAQAPANVDFARDVQPILTQSCIGCHGPTQQMNGLRLDRRKDAMRGGTFPAIGPGNGEGSQLYLRIAGTRFGMQMPPTGALKPEQIAIIKAWIDQGAEWPDEFSGDVAPPLPDPGATRLNDALRRGDAEVFRVALNANPATARLKGGGGTTPLMAAALYADADAMRLLLERGADPNTRNEAGATALMWAVGDTHKARLLIEGGADVNARSSDGRTPLMIAAGRFGSSEVATLLLDRGADPNATGPIFGGLTSPLVEAASAGDAALFRLLVDRGADPKAAGPIALYSATRSGCGACADLLLQSAPPPVLSLAALFLAPPGDTGQAVQALIDRGADANTTDQEGRTLLMLAASSDALPIEMARRLLQRGADVHARSPKGETALAQARQRGQTAMVDLLLDAGAKDDARSSPPAPTPRAAASARAAILRSLPLLQRSDATFLRKSGCVSCHNNTLTGMTIAAARRQRLAVDDALSGEHVKKIAAFIDSWRERALQNVGIPGDADSVSYILLGLAAQGHPPDAATDALAMFLRNKQMADGHWWIVAHRPPLESSDIQVTAASMHALQLYAPQARRAEYAPVIQRAAAWLTAAAPRSTEERVFHLLGLRWAGTARETIRTAGRALAAEQRRDGGWAQLASLPSDAYATGQALTALVESGALTNADPVFKRGARFLIDTQLEDGSWFVRSRAIPIQPFFESDFPHGHNQWISAAATNWATMALALASRDGS